MIQLRDYQNELSTKGLSILKEKRIVYFGVEVRCGKTLISLNVANLYGVKKVLFLTKKKAISSIENDYNALQPDFSIQIINNESIHKITDNDFDLIISDEHHRLSAYPKPNKTAKLIKERFGHLPMIFLSGTPAIESGSQWFHSFWVSNNSPFKQFKNFYCWAKVYVNKKTRYLGAIQIPDYSDAKTSDILKVVNDYLITFTQKEAGFESDITENVLYCDMKPKTNEMINTLLKTLVLQGTNEVILADTPVKLMSKIHQIENGTAIFESGNSMILDSSKAEFIKKHFTGCKIGIFYFFAKELEVLKAVFGDELTTDLNEFNETYKNIALQQVSGSEGISLKNADCIVYMNWGYSGKNYVQSIARMQTIDRKENNVYFVMQRNGINEKIYNVLKQKKTYSESLFKKDYGIRK